MQFANGGILDIVKGLRRHILGQLVSLLEKEWQPTPVFLPWDSRGQRSQWTAVHRVAQCRTLLKRLSMQACIGEGNGNPLQYSCLENPRDRGAWCAAVYGVTQNQTRLKWLSSSSSVFAGPQNFLVCNDSIQRVDCHPKRRGYSQVACFRTGETLSHLCSW